MKHIQSRPSNTVDYVSGIIGDRINITILREILSFGNQTFNDFMKHNQIISTSTLTYRLQKLERAGLIKAQTDSTDGRRKYYAVTSRGAALIPAVYELAVWVTNDIPDAEVHPIWKHAMACDRTQVIEAWRVAVEAGDSFFNGEKSVAKQLNLAEEDGMK